MDYFDILENSVSSKDEKDLIILKKALYLIKEGDLKSGNELLKKIISEESNLQSLAKNNLK